MPVLYSVVAEKSFVTTTKPKIVVSLVDNGKTTNLNIREYYTDKTTNEDRPSKAGLFLPLTDTDKPVVKSMLLEALIMSGTTKDEVISYLKKPTVAPKAKKTRTPKNK